MKKSLVILFMLLGIVVKAQTLHFHQLTVKDGLPHNSIIALAQDAKGDIWVATHAGLCRYDGLQLVSMSTEGLPDKRIDRINRAEDGTMWVQCFERHQLVSRYDSLTGRFVTYKVSDLSDSLRRQAIQPLNRTFADPHSSRVWTIEKRQLLQTDTLQPNSQFAYTGQIATDAELKDGMFYSLLLDSQGILWAGSANNGLYFADTHQSRYRRIVCQPTPMVRAILLDSKGALWIAISDLQVLTVPKGADCTTHVNYPMNDTIEGRRVRAFAEDNKGRIWMGSREGLYVKEATATDFRRVDMGVKGMVTVFCLCNDENKQLWIGADRGLFRLPLDKPQLKAEYIDSTVTAIGKIAVDKNRLWMATDNGLYCRIDNETTQWYSEAAHQIIIDDRGQTWVGTDNGLIRISEQGAEHVSTAADGHIIKDMLCWRDFLWCSYEQGLCCVNIYTGQSTILHTKHNEYLDGSAFLDERTGTLYFGGTIGIDCLKADSLDEQLRSGTPQLWLEEDNEELSMEDDESAWPVWIYALILAIVAMVAYILYIYRRRGQKKAPAGTTELSPESTRSLSPFILKATAIAEAHIADTNFTAEQMAQELAMSRTKLFLLMKNETGKAVMEFVRDIRLDFAANQLKKDAPVNEIYMACGFSDPSSFRRSFARKFGINPSQYREQHKNTNTTL